MHRAARRLRPNESAVLEALREEAEPIELDPDRPFRVLLAGDFSGRSWRENDPAPFVPKRIDRDNFDDVLASMKIRLNLHGISLPVRELEDFHPDRIYQLPLFEEIDKHLPASNPPAASRLRANRIP